MQYNEMPTLGVWWCKGRFIFTSINGICFHFGLRDTCGFLMKNRRSFDARFPLSEQISFLVFISGQLGTPLDV
jgi:hypothetical protein